MERLCPHCGGTLPASDSDSPRRLSVADVMTSNLVTLGPEDSLMRALEVMRLHSIRRIPVVVGETLVGLIVEGDLKRAQPSALSDSQEEFNQVMEDTPVSRIMVSRPICVTEDTPLVEAATTLRETKFGALPVLRDGRLVGIVTDVDLITALCRLL
jgi:acetoin utilization protein AcuB